MTFPNSKVGVLVAGWMALTGMLPALAELPMLKDKEQLGYFVIVKNRVFQFDISQAGKISFKLLGKKGEAIQKQVVAVDFLVEETLPDGKVVRRQVKTETLESAQPATTRPQDIVIRGKVTGDASFEMFASEGQGGIALGGRLVDPGTSKNPMRFAISLKFPNVYVDAKKDGDKKEVKEFEEKIKKDKVQLVWTDKERVKLSGNDRVDAGSKEVNGPGIASAQIEFFGMQERRFDITATENSMMTLSSASPGPLNQGFSLTWSADAAKDPQHKARLVIKAQ